ncbi:Methionine aminopeptidase [Buchnera aphidicola (Eriosoma grossulariae)]|uniref:type I methionyl aminopeptidase n=1 Tax=Buchnera aphidicola TaxID=9 RepID=UPI0034644454
MTIPIKTNQEIEKIRLSCQLAANVLDMIEEYIIPNMNTEKINQICHDYIKNVQKAIPACLGYRGYPKSICISINDVVCHGIPNTKKILKIGDIVNIDIAILKNQYYGDASRMYIVQKTSILGKRLCQITLNSLYLSLSIIKPGIPLKKIGTTIQKYVEKHDFSVVQEYCGHGIGKNFHEEPQILHYEGDDQGIVLKKNMIFTIEPMVNTGSREIKLMKDQWTVKTKDRSLSAQYEHTILVTENGCEVLTKQYQENISKFFIN